MAATVGSAFTTSVAVTNDDPQVPETVYVIVADPAVTPVTLPVASMVATAVLLLLQVPPAKLSLSILVPPTHSLSVPVIAGITGAALTVSVWVTDVGQPSALVTV